MRAGRLVELVMLLQARSPTTARELAAALEVSIRTVHRDLEALSGAGVPVYAERGRNGGIRLDEGYRLGGLPLGDTEARAALLVAAPTVARSLGIDTSSAEALLLSSMDERAERAARVVRDRLLIEPEAWFRPPEEVPFLPAVTAAVGDCQELRIRYDGDGGPSERVVRPLGLVLKGDLWYLLAGTRRGDRIFRVSRIREVTPLVQRFEPPADFDLAQMWEHHKHAFLSSLPSYVVTVRVEPRGEEMLHLLREGAPGLPLPPDVSRDEDGWAILTLRFDRWDTAARSLLQLGSWVEVLDPPELRVRMTRAADRLHQLYSQGVRS